jgi:1-acyl-sn-glycerol-3-phosphate acyltransferase
MTGKTTDQRWGFLALISSAPPRLGTLGYAVGYTSAYGVFVLGCLAIAAAAPVAGMIHGDRRRRIIWLRGVASRVARIYLGYCRLIRMVKVEFIGERKLPPGLIVANHPSLVDALWLISTQPDICCVLKGDLERFGLFRYLATQLDYVSNQDPERLLAEGCARLRQGETLLVFPEATRTPPGELPTFRLGAAELAVRTAVPVHPVVVHKAGSYLSKARPWYAFPNQPLRWQIVFTDTLAEVRTDSPRQARRQLTAELQKFFHQEITAYQVAQRPPRTET